VTDKTSANVQLKKVTYAYDPFDRRIAKEIDLPGGSTIDDAEYFVYDAEDIVLVYDETGSVKNRYLHGPGIDEVLADEAFSAGVYDDTYWTLPDHLGTVRDLVDRDANVNGGQPFLAQSRTLDVWGEPHGKIGPHWDWVDPFGNKRRFNPETGKWTPDENNNPNKPKPLFPEGRLETATYVVVTVGFVYVTYRVVRLLPSLAPPLWWTLPGNLVIS
jgi:hypothetical protein